MKQSIVCTIAVLLLLGAQAARAENHFYTQLDAHQFFNVDDFDDEQSLGVTLGYSFSDKSSVEFEYQVNGFDDDAQGFEVDADVLTYLLNYRHTLYRDENWSINGRLGAGFSEPEFGTSATTRGKDSILVWHVGLGAEYAWRSGVYAAADARLQDFGQMKDTGVSYDVGTPVVVGLSLGYRF